MLDPDRSFQLTSISRRNIVDELNNILDADHQLPPGSDLVTDEVILGWIDSLNSRDFPDENEAATMDTRLAVNTAVELGLIDHIDEEWKDYIDVWYVITGVDRHNRRFRKDCGDNELYARGHNVWNGTLWRVTNAGRKKIHTWSN